MATDTLFWVMVRVGLGFRVIVAKQKERKEEERKN